jgi:hypothetical protein
MTANNGRTYLQAFAPYSTVIKTGFKASTTFVFTEAVLGIQVQCTGAGGIKFNNQTVHFPLAATTNFTYFRNQGAVQLAISSAASNTCRFMVH